MKRDERNDDFLKFENHQNPPDDSTPKCFEKKSARTNYSSFSFESSESYLFFNYLHVSNPTFRVAGINTETFFGRTVIDDQDDLEGIGVKLLSYNQSLAHSAYDSAESIATPPDSTSKTINYVRLWLHPCLYGNERKMKDKHELITLNEKA